MLRHLKMRNDGPAPTNLPVFIGRNEVIQAGVTGIFYPSVERGRTVATGSRIGHITDFHGRVIEEVVAGFDGEVLYIVGTPPVTKGEPVAMIGSRQ